MKKVPLLKIDEVLFLFEATDDRDNVWYVVAPNIDIARDLAQHWLDLMEERYGIKSIEAVDTPLLCGHKEYVVIHTTPPDAPRSMEWGSEFRKKDMLRWAKERGLEKYIQNTK